MYFIPLPTSEIKTNRVTYESTKFFCTCTFDTCRPTLGRYYRPSLGRHIIGGQSVDISAVSRLKLGRYIGRYSVDMTREPTWHMRSMGGHCRPMLHRHIGRAATDVSTKSLPTTRPTVNRDGVGLCCVIQTENIAQNESLDRVY